MAGSERMAKITAEERWDAYVEENCQAFRQSSELQHLRSLGLNILGRKGLVPQDEWWGEMNSQGPMASKEYLVFQEECRRTGADFGLSPWAVEWICLMEGYDPENSLHVVEAQWAKIQVVTQNSNEKFLGWLLYEAGKLGLDVVQKYGSFLMPLICIPYPQQPAEPLAPSQRPPLTSAFQVTQEIPPGYPPEATAALARRAAQLGRELARRLGYPMPYRMRRSPLISQAADLKVGQPLSSGEIYDIIETKGEGDISEDQKLRNRTKSQRSRVSKKLRERGGKQSLG